MKQDIETWRIAKSDIEKWFKNKTDEEILLIFNGTQIKAWNERVDIPS